MHHRIWMHVVWTTRDREPLIDRDRAAALVDLLPRIASGERARIDAIGIVATHLHLLMRLHPTTVLPKVLQRLKGGSAHALNRSPAALTPPLRWAKGYSVSSVSQRSLPDALGYVRAQHFHHPAEAIPGWPQDADHGAESGAWCERDL